MERWEIGSEFHFFRHRDASGETNWPSPAAYYGSGRDAMRGILSHGQMLSGWKRLWVPFYFCQDVVSTLRETGIEVVLYPDGPRDPFATLDRAALCKGDVVLLMNYFGLRCTASHTYELQACGAQVLEDHSHDPWSRWADQSTADWCVASLRKTLPIPDGGILWSPKGHELPDVPQVTEQRQIASLQKLGAMALKALYLSSQYDDKQAYRALGIEGEREIAGGEISGMPLHSLALLRTFPISDWRVRRRHNIWELYNRLQNLEWLECLGTNTEADIYPFGGILLMDSEVRRNNIRAKLIDACVYPAILWSLENLPSTPATQSYIDFSRRIIMIHCDMRYGRQDMQRVATLITRFGEEV